MDDARLSLLITCAAAAVFVVSGWATLCVVLARRSGWMTLAAAYKSREKVAATQFRFQTIRFEPATTLYFKCVRLRFAIEGMWLAPSLFLRPGHAPLLVPWDQIEIYTHDVDRSDRQYELGFAQTPDIRLRINATIAQRFRRAADNVQYFLEGQNDMPGPGPERRTA